MSPKAWTISINCRVIIAAAAFQCKVTMMHSYCYTNMSSGFRLAHLQRKTLRSGGCKAVHRDSCSSCAAWHLHNQEISFSSWRMRRAEWRTWSGTCPKIRPREREGCGHYSGNEDTVSYKKKNLNIKTEDDLKHQLLWLSYGIFVSRLMFSLSDSLAQLLLSLKVSYPRTSIDLQKFK